MIKVERAWDVREGHIEPKSRAGRRTVPIPMVLRDYLVEHKQRTGGRGHVFARANGKPFDAVTIGERSKSAWRRAALEPITLHEARHTFASLMIAAGVNAKALQTFMRHASITVTLDRYGKLVPGSDDEAAVLLNAYLERAHA